MNNYEKIKQMSMDEMAEYLMEFSHFYFSLVIEALASKVKEKFIIEPNPDEQIKEIKKFLQKQWIESEEV